jgi:hypothetical protein
MYTLRPVPIVYFMRSSRSLLSRSVVPPMSLEKIAALRSPAINATCNGDRLHSFRASMLAPRASSWTGRQSSSGAKEKPASRPGHPSKCEALDDQCLSYNPQPSSTQFQSRNQAHVTKRSSTWPLWRQRRKRQLWYLSKKKWASTETGYVAS